MRKFRSYCGWVPLLALFGPTAVVLGAPETGGAPPISSDASNTSNAPGTSEIRVTLLGQICSLSGPFPAKTLKLVHSVSPEQMPAMPEREHLKETLDRLRAAKELPAGLDAYRARLLRRLEAQNAFFDSLAAAKKSEKPEDLLAGTRSYVDARKLPEYQAKVTNLASKQPIGKWTTESSGQIADFYSGAIEAHPEEEFHRAIQRIGVHYNCDFDEG